MRRAIFLVSLALGVGLFLFLYGVIFDNMSETTLVMVTPLWFFPIAFGAYGLLAQRGLRMLREGRGDSLQAVLHQIAGTLGLLGHLAVLPLALSRGRDPVAIAAIGAVVWAAPLATFVLLVFPQL
jgi:hypothetical protein